MASIKVSHVNNEDNYIGSYTDRNGNRTEYFKYSKFLWGVYSVGGAKLGLAQSRKKDLENKIINRDKSQYSRGVYEGGITN